MAWRGRKRTLGERYGCGKLRPTPKTVEPEQPHRKGYGTNPLAETVHGRYFMDGLITGPQHVAGEIYRRARLQYRAALQITDGLSRGERGVRGEDEDRDVRAVQTFRSAQEAMGAWGRDVERVIGMDFLPGDLNGYRRGLDCLRRLWGI